MGPTQGVSGPGTCSSRAKGVTVTTGGENVHSRLAQSQTTWQQASEPEADPTRMELAGLKLSALIKRATVGGASAEQLEEAQDGDSAKVALIELIADLEANRAGNDMDTPQQRERELRAELEAMGVGALAARAIGEGLDEAALYEAMDEGQAAMIQLLIASAADSAQVLEEEQSATQALRRELEGLKLGALQRRALADGVASEDVLAAADQDEPRVAMIELVIAATAVQSHRGAGARSNGPHFGAESAAKAVKPPPNTKHVMLSYNWSHQTQVKRAFDELTRLGLNCWMDITGVTARSPPVRFTLYTCEVSYRETCMVGDGLRHI